HLIQKEFSPPEPSPLAFQQEPTPPLALIEEGSSKKLIPGLVPPTMPSFPSLDELEAASCADWFDLELISVPKEDGSGYLFAATLIPHSNLTIHKMRQDYTFLIDRSNSIQKDRLLAAKNAVRSALDELTPQDTFNILTFDNKVEKLFPA